MLHVSGEHTGLQHNIRLCRSLDGALENVFLIQKCGPENIAFKQDFWKTAGAAAPNDALFCSSSSGIPASRQSLKMEIPHRLLIAHPFNPPHILPLVELCPNADTPHTLLDRACSFYRSIGKHLVILNKEIPGFVANRLQIALLNEAVYWVSEGICTPKQLDEIVTHSIGIRWACTGPLHSAHLGGGADGISHFLNHIGRSLAACIGQEEKLSAERIDRISRLTNRDYPADQYTAACRQRDYRQTAVLKTLSDTKN